MIARRFHPSLLRRQIPLRVYLGPGLLLLVGVIMMLWTWGTWPDVLIDFGGQLYFAWQLSRDKVLYTDLAEFKGPLSHYVNALWFRLFGASLHTLIICNLAIFAVLVGILYRLLHEISDRFAATVGGLTLILLFGFGQLVGIGNYNFVCPYSHPVTHGIVLSALAIFCLARYHQRRRPIALTGAGLALGLAFLTDAHIFLSGALAVSVGLGLVLLEERPVCRRAWGVLSVFAAAAILPIVMAFLLLCRLMSPSQALNGLLGSWPWIFGGKITSMAFYQTGIGLDHPLDNLGALVIWALRYAGVLLPLVVLASVVRVPKVHRLTIMAAVFLAVTVLLKLIQIKWTEAFRPLPVCMAGLGILSLIGWIRHRKDARVSGVWILRVVMALWAVALLGKIMLYARIYHYGFALAMPATLLLTVALISWVPNRLGRHGGSGVVFRAGALAIWFICILTHLQMMNAWFNHKTVIVGQGRDSFRADWRGHAVNALLREITVRTQTDDTLAVFPGQVMINYLAKRANPTPYTGLWPFTVTLVGEDRILASLRAHPPDYVALVHFDTSEEGRRFFGRDYAQELYAWIRAHYQAVVLIGDPPLRDQRFGILLLKWSG